MDLDILLKGLDCDSEVDETLESVILENIADKEFLKQIVIHRNSPNKLRKLSIANIYDEQFLFEQAIKSYPTYGDRGIDVLATSVKKVAVHQIKSEIYLKKIVIHSNPDRDIPKAAIKRITDQDFLKTIVMESLSLMLVKAALWEINDKKFLEDLINSSDGTDLLNSVKERLFFLNRD